MAKHVLPLLLDLRPVRRVVNGGSVGHGDTGMRALPLQDPTNRRCQADQVWMAVHVYDVVEVPRPASLGEGAQLLAEQLDQGVAQDADPRREERRCTDGLSVGGPVDRRGASSEVMSIFTLGSEWRRIRSSVGDAALGRGVASPVPASPE